MIPRTHPMMAVERVRAGPAWICWAGTVLTALLFSVQGVALLAGVQQFVQDMAQLGIPLYFLPILACDLAVGRNARGKYFPVDPHGPRIPVTSVC